MTATIELHWIPLGAGQRVVQTSGRLFEALSASIQRRHACQLYHSALRVERADGYVTIEMTPVPDGHGDRRGVVAEGAVGLRWLGRFQHFRYEIRRWSGGAIPDLAEASASTRIDVTEEAAQRLLDLVPLVPTPVWGRDELGAGDMWNSNSVTSWVLSRSGVDMTTLRPPAGGRAPGWDAGLSVATRARPA